MDYDKDDLEMQLIKKPIQESVVKSNHNTNGIAFTGLTKAELEKFENDEPIWKKIRITLLIIFVVIWVGLLAAAVILIVLTPGCPPRVALDYWQSGCTYRLNPYAFKDSNDDGYGDFKGIISKLDYFEKELKVKTLIIDPINKGNKIYLGLSSDFKAIDATLGDMEGLRTLLKEVKKKSMNSFLTLDFMSIGVENDLWVKNKGKYFRKASPTYTTVVTAKDATCNGFYQVFINNATCEAPMINMSDTNVLNMIKDSLKFWLKDVGFDGIVLTNLAFYTNGGTDEKVYGSFAAGQLFSNNTKVIVGELRKVFDEVYSDTGKKRFLLVEGGNTGVSYDEVQQDPIIVYTMGDKLAHGALTSNLLYNKGDKTNTKAFDILKHIKAYGENETSFKLGFPMADMFHIRYVTLESIAGMFLLRGFPIIYMGTEIEQSLVSNIKTFPAKVDPSLEFYPFDKRTTGHKSYNDQSFYNYGVMQWTRHSKDFSNKTYDNYDKNYRSVFDMDINVELAKSIGSPRTVYNLIVDLVKLRELETMQWGNTNVIAALPTAATDKKVIAFSRAAEGFATIIVVFVRADASAAFNNRAGVALSFTKYCKRAKVEVVYPEKSRLLKRGKLIDMSSIYVGLTSEKLIVFRCQ